MKEKLKGKLKKLVISLLVILSALTICLWINEVPTFADSGHSVSHSSSHSSSSHSSSSSSHRSSSSSSSGSSSGSVGVAGIIFYIAVIIIIIIIAKAASKNNIQKIANFDDTNVENKIKAIISDFNKKEFLDNGFKIYKDVQDAWMNFKLDDVKDEITDEIYNMYDSQLSVMEVKNEQNIMKDIQLKNCYLTDVVDQNGTITISTKYVVELYDYIINSETKKTLTGLDNRKIRVTYTMKFRRTVDENAKIENCPNCGAKLDMNGSGVCDYCGSKIVSENVKWVLTEKTLLNQVTL